MFFRRKTVEPPTRADDWQVFAEKLELQDASTHERMLRNVLDLAPESELGSVYGVPLDPSALGGSGMLLLFDYLERRTGPAGSAAQMVSVCMISSKDTLANVALKASRKLHKVLESLAASASGGTPLDFSDDPEFNDHVTVYARDIETAKSLLSPHVKMLLKKALNARESNPTFLLGERHLLFLQKAPETKPIDLNVLELLSSDLMSLYAAIIVSQNEAKNVKETV